MFNRLINNKKKFLLLSIILIVIIIFVIFLFGYLKKDVILFVRNEDGIKFANEYEKLNNQEHESGKLYPKVELPNDNIIKYSSVSEVIDLFENNKDGVVYFGYSTCLYCRSAIQVLVDIAYDSELDVIHYIDMEKVWDNYKLDKNNKVVKTNEADEKYYQLLDLLGNELTYDYSLETSDEKKINTGVKRIEVPLVIFMTDGKVISYNKGTLFSQISPFDELDEDQKKGLGQIYYYGIRDVVDSKKNKGLLK